MSHFSAVPILVLSTLLLSACGDEQLKAPIFSDGENPGSTQPVFVGQASQDRASPEFQGDLEFSTTLTVALDTVLEESDVNKAFTGIMARDGLTVRVPVEGASGQARGFILIDTISGDANWMFKDLSKDTRIIFDANNFPVAVLAIGCEPAIYTAEQDVTLTDMTSLLPGGRCFSAEQRASADGNVVIFGSYTQGAGTAYLSATTRFHAYTLNTASLVDYPDSRLGVDGVTLSPRWPDSLFTNTGFSDDGRWLLTRQWWEGTETFGGTRRQVGAVLWNTTSGDWRTLGLMADQRNCIPTRNVSCRPAYSYVMSSDGMTQYAQVPTIEEINPGAGPIVQFATITQRSATNQPGATVISGMASGTSLNVDGPGSRIVFVATNDTDTLRKGYTLYEAQSEQYISLNRALRACPTSDEDGETIAESECPYTSIPRTITSNATTFTADGSRLLLRAISRSTDAQKHVVDSFLMDIADGNVYTIPTPFSGDALAISGDGAVMLGVTGFPNYDFVIGRR